MRRFGLLAVLLTIIGCLASEARACLGPPIFLMFDTVPFGAPLYDLNGRVVDISKSTIAQAEIIGRTDDPRDGAIYRLRIDKVIQGQLDAPTIVMRVRGFSNCGPFIKIGDHGIVAGRLRKENRGELGLVPILNLRDYLDP